MAGGDTYAFVDGGCLLKDFEAAAQPWFGVPSPALDLQILRTLTGANKLFYYDCVPENPVEGEDTIAFQAKKAAKLAQVGKFQRTPYCQVRVGALVQRKRLKKLPEQKRVDVLLTVEALQHAVRQNLKTAILVTGDQDFIPLVDALVEHGVNVHVWASQGHVSQELADAADVYRELRFWDLLGLADQETKDAYPVPSQPSITSSGLPEKLVLTGTASGGRQVRVFAYEVRGTNGTGTIHTACLMHPAHPNNQNVAERWRTRELDKAKLFCERQFGGVVWDATPQTGGS